MPLNRRYDDEFGTILNPGTFRHQITYQDKAISGQNDFGEDLISWVDFQTLKAQIVNLTGRELANMQQVWAGAEYKIAHYRVAGIQREMQIYWYRDGENLTLDILDIQDPPGWDQFQIVIAKEHMA